MIQRACRRKNRKGSNRKRFASLAAAACLILPLAASAAVGARGGCGTGVNSAICVGQMQVPAKQVALFQAAGTGAVDALASPGFRRDLEAFIAGLSPADPHAAAWTNRDAAALADGLLRGVDGVDIRTYGGLWAWITAKGPTRNVAKEGRPGGPILLNRYAVGTHAEVANSIAHEAAHRAPLLLRHPSYDESPTVGYCEPPYVIGQLVEKQVAGPSWKPEDADCGKLRDL